MNPLKLLYYKACSLLPTSWAGRLSPVRTLFPYYHLISDEVVPHIRHLYPFKNVAQFRADVDVLLRHFRPATPPEIAAALSSGKPLPRGSFLLTFDDGLREVYTVIAPILREKKVPAVFFINPAFVDNKELFYRCKISLIIEELSRRNDALAIGASVFGKTFASEEQLKAALKSVTQDTAAVLDQFAEALLFSFDNYLKEHQPFLTTDQIKELSAQGFYFGAHSWDHPYYKLLNAGQQVWQTEESLRFVDDLTGATPRMFSFPHSDAVVPQSFFADMEKKSKPVEVFFGIQNQKYEAENRMVHRFNAERPDVKIRGQINGILLYCTWKKITAGYKIKRV